MPYEANVTDVAYRYDGSFAGFLCCVFESYARHEIPSEVCPPEEGQLTGSARSGWRWGWTGSGHRSRIAL